MEREHLFRTIKNSEPCWKNFSHIASAILLIASAMLELYEAVIQLVRIWSSYVSVGGCHIVKDKMADPLPVDEKRLYK